MTTEGAQIDFGGARGSNTGDVFHELWAVRQALKLLDPSCSLSAMTVEGVPAADGSGSEWDGVDCTLLYGAESAGEADRVVVQQLKYSASNPGKRWTPARMCCGKSGKPSSSLLRRLGVAFKQLLKLREGQQVDAITIALVTNQPISPAILSIIERAKIAVPSTYKRAWKKGDPDMHRLVHASGLTPNQFKQFASCLNLQGQTGSRFALEDRALADIAQWADTEFVSIALRLRDYVRRRMMPEAAGEVVDRQSVLMQFGVSDERALFPCPSAISTVAHLVPRTVSKIVVDAVVAGDQRVCLHGAGGVGKTTTLQEIASQLPDGSEMIVFDCYGAGSYLDASDLRHRPRDAFVQLSNEIAQRLRLPAFLEPNRDGESARAFRRRLELAASTLSSFRPGALLVVAVDAADNSIIAARRRTPPDPSFVTELMSFQGLPASVRLIISSRTGRLEELEPPQSFKQIELLPFGKEETTRNVARFWRAPKSWIEDFHHLSAGVPRVQAYAFEQVGEAYADALAPLRPLGKKLNELFDEQFTLAMSKSGETDLIDKVCAALTVLPRPVPVLELASVLSLSVSQVIDICADLAPGVRNQAGFLSLKDEDFEFYVRDRGAPASQEVLQIAAQRLLNNASRDEYAALNVAPLLFQAGRGNDSTLR